MDETRLYDKVFGLLAGCALGDAFGIRVEMMHYRDIAEQYGRVDHFDPLPRRKPSSQPPGEQWQPFGVQVQDVKGFHPLGRWSRETGAYTDDTRYRLMICQAILRKGGVIDGSDLAAEWLNYRLMAEGAEETLPTLSWEGPQREYARLIASLENLAWMVNSQRFTVKSWDAPLGLLYPGRPEEAARVGYSMASAVAAALAPDATFDGMVDAVLKNADSLGSQAAEFRGRVQRLLDTAAHCKDVFDLYEPFYKHFLVAFPPWEAVFPLEMVPCAIAICSIAKTDARQAIVGATNVGRDSDTIAAIAGELMGVLYGAKALPQDWLAQVLRCNPAPDLPQMARELCAVLARLAGQAQQASAQLLALSGQA